jgi:MFS family permease
MAVIAIAPTPLTCLPGAVLVGAAAGTFLAVDWALITDLVPKASAGRHMGISNVATATNGLVALLLRHVVEPRERAA